MMMIASHHVVSQDFLSMLVITLIVPGICKLPKCILGMVRWLERMVRPLLCGFAESDKLLPPGPAISHSCLRTSRANRRPRMSSLISSAHLAEPPLRSHSCKACPGSKAGMQIFKEGRKEGNFHWNRTGLQLHFTTLAIQGCGFAALVWFENWPWLDFSFSGVLHQPWKQCKRKIPWLYMYAARQRQQTSTCLQGCLCKHTILPHIRTHLAYSLTKRLLFWSAGVLWRLRKIHCARIYQSLFWSNWLATWGASCSCFQDEFQG